MLRRHKSAQIWRIYHSNTSRNTTIYHTASRIPAAAYIWTLYNCGQDGYDSNHGPRLLLPVEEMQILTRVSRPFSPLCTFTAIVNGQRDSGWAAKANLALVWQEVGWSSKVGSAQIKFDATMKRKRGFSHTGAHISSGRSGPGKICTATLFMSILCMDTS